MQDGNESFVRWQKIAIDQLGYSVNLLLGLAVAILGFGFSMLRDKGFPPGCWSKVAFTLSIFSMIVSLASGVFCSLTRLCDFRKTARIARDRGWAPQTSLTSLRIEARELGEWTWILFRVQQISFASGTLLMAFSLMVFYRVQLF